MNAKELLNEISVPQNLYTNQHASKLINIFNLIKSIKNDITDCSIVDQIEKYPIGKRTETRINLSGDTITNTICSGYEIKASQFLVQTKNGEYTFVCPLECELHSMFCLILGIESSRQSKDIAETITFAPELIGKLKKAIKYAKGPKEIIARNNDHISILVKDGFAEVCATDFHRLYLSGKVECTGKDQQILINPRSFSKIRAIKEKDVKMNVDFSLFKQNNAVFADFCGVTLELTEGEYPNYHAVIPDYTEKMTFNQMDIYNSVMLVKKYANKSSELIHFHLNGNVKISARDEDFGTESASVVRYESKTFPDMDIAFNASLFLSVIETFKSENIEMYSNGINSKCAVFKCENSNDIALLMPLQFDEETRQNEPQSHEQTEPEQPETPDTPLEEKTLKPWEMTKEQIINMPESEWKNDLVKARYYAQSLLGTNEIERLRGEWKIDWNNTESIIQNIEHNIPETEKMVTQNETSENPGQLPKQKRPILGDFSHDKTAAASIAPEKGLKRQEKNETGQIRRVKLRGKLTIVVIEANHVLKINPNHNPRREKLYRQKAPVYVDSC